MAYHPRFEWKEESSFLTTRSRNSRLWLVNNQLLEDVILGYAARYRERREVKLYALAIEGNHIHGVANFPLGNRRDFMRDFNAQVACAVQRYVPEYEGGGLWASRYSAEMLPPAPEDIEDRFFYAVLQAVNDGHVQRISDYPGYNCFHDAVWGIKRKYKVIHWAEYNVARRYGKKVHIRDFTEIVTLEYERLPGYEDLSQRDYAILMSNKLEERRQKLVRERLAKGLGFTGTEALRKVVPGSLPKNTKTSTRNHHRPRVLSVCPERRTEYETVYFGDYFKYKVASQAYREGDLDVEFPKGSYKPYLPAAQRE